MNETVTLILPEQSQQLIQRSEGETLMAIISRAASNPTVDVEKLERLLGMHERIMAKQAEIDFNEALARVAPLLPRIKRNGEVLYAEEKGSKVMKKAFNFALWEDVDEGIRPIISKEGFTLSWDTAPRSGDGGGCVVTGKLSHIGGHSRTASIGLALDSSGGKNNLQAMASTISYGKRYTAFMLLNIVTEGEDDDAQAANTITTEQAADIDTRARALGEKKFGDFLNFMSVRTAIEIRATDYQKAVNAISAVEKAMEKKQKEGIK